MRFGKVSIAELIFNNTRRPHSSLDDKIPDEAYWQKNTAWLCRTNYQTGGLNMKAFRLMFTAALSECLGSPLCICVAD